MTLLEVMVALFIVTIIMAVVFTAYIRIMQLRRRAEDLAEVAATGRAAMDLVRRDLQGAFRLAAALPSAPPFGYEVYVPDGEFPTYEDAAIACGKALIRFLYATIEKQRRRAIGQMLQSARDAVSLGPAVFREHLIAYLEESEFTRQVGEVTRTSDPGAWLVTLEAVGGLDSVTKLLGACRRALEEDPGHPGLLMIGGTCRLACFGPGEGEQDLASAFAALGRYVADPAARAALAGRLLASIDRLAPSSRDHALAAMLGGDTTRAMARVCYEQATTDSAAHHAAIMALAESLADALAQGRGTHD